MHVLYRCEVCPRKGTVIFHLCHSVKLDEGEIIPGKRQSLLLYISERVQVASRCLVLIAIGELYCSFMLNCLNSLRVCCAE